ncbi:MAG TPA: TPM domain-containing protein [Spirochaetota bacterium]|nr:TPM domain-containing protein [Spirochaetota bacterium]HOR44708.1 TPM domain-containing protein [Spirochaetota bacterium]HOU83573.1 TPM domain-containing protein [Spirochaetota bacterium]HPK56519.1 TPM domain-containing protein [Spirochaetota bacterium]HQE59343.1 TPM domain-containing protein [Spirochaetota bacterium]
MKKILFLSFIIAIFPFIVQAQEIPDLKGRINDYADMFSEETEKDLEEKLAELEKTDSTQIAVLSVNSLEGYPIEEFSIKTAEKWKIGQKGKDNGVILIFSKTDRKIRIEVGYGLEEKLTDLTAGRIIDNEITPKFKVGLFDQGLKSGIDAVISVVKGTYTFDGNSGNDSESPMLMIVVVLLVVIFILGKIKLVLGGVTGAIAFPIMLYNLSAEASLVSIILFIPFGFIMGLIIPLLGTFFMLSSNGRGRRGGGFSSGSGFSGGGFSGGGFSGGGFSGGGGRFGGGGASGGW